jgi:recombination protein RecT
VAEQATEQTELRRPAGGRQPSKEVVKLGDFEGPLHKLVLHYQGNLSRVMPKHVKPDAFIGLAVAYVGTDPKLYEAASVNPQSLIIALRECAALGHTPVKDTFALVPYRNNDPKKGPPQTVVGIETYRGVIERMYRAGGVLSVRARVVREKDFYDFDPASGVFAVPQHRFPRFAGPSERGHLVGVYAYAVLRSGATSEVIEMGPEDIAKHRAKSRSGEAFWGPEWPLEGPWTQDMWLKTALHKLEALVPTSAEYLWEMAASQSAAAGAGFPAAPAAAGSPPSAAADIEDAVIVGEGGGDQR